MRACLSVLQSRGFYRWLMGTDKHRDKIVWRASLRKTRLTQINDLIGHTKPVRIFLIMSHNTVILIARNIPCYCAGNSLISRSKFPVVFGGKLARHL